MIWNLSQANSIPGVPSGNHPSAGVAVEVNDANEVVSVTPLASTDFVAAIEEDAPVVEDKAVTDDAKNDKKAASTDTDAPDKAQP